MTRDDSIIRHLAEKVMGWHLVQKSDKRVVAYMPGGGMTTLYWDRGDDAPIRLWNPLESGDDMMMVWERAHALGYGCSLENYIDPEGSGYWRALASHSAADDDVDVSADSGPRAICEAVALATGWKEDSNG